MADRFQFSLKSLFILAFIIASLCTAGVLLHRKWRYEWGYGPYYSFHEWPRSLVALIGRDTDLRADVEPFGLGGFFDHRSIWRIKHGSPLRQLLFDAHTLEPCNMNHPKASMLIESVPNKWTAFRWEDCNWHATPHYGSAHIEGMDLFLVAENPDTGDLIVLHEWNF